MMLPIFKFKIHSFWFRKPNTVLISIYSSYLPLSNVLEPLFLPYSSPLSLTSRSTSSMSSSSLIARPFSLFSFFFFTSAASFYLSSFSIFIFLSPKFFASFSLTTAATLWNACKPFFPLVPAKRFPNSYMIGSNFKAVLSIIEIDSSMMLYGMSLTGEFSLINSF